MSVQLPGSPTVVVAATFTLYVPGGVVAATLIWAVAVPPTVVAGVWLVRVMVPGSVGVMELMLRSVTTPSASDALTVATADAPWRALTAGPQSATTGAGPPVTLCVPSPLKVFTGKPFHSAAGSKVSLKIGSPSVTDALRCRVLSAVLASPVPHSVPGSTPTWPMTSIGVPLRTSNTASSPLNHPEAFVWSAWARMAGSAVAWASTNTSPAATVPVRGIVKGAEFGGTPSLPLKYICTA